MTSAGECLFNSTVPVLVRPLNSSPSGLNAGFSGFNPAQSQSTPFPFYSTTTPVQFQQPDNSGVVKRVNSVVFEIYLHTIVANKKSLQLRISDVNDPFFMWQLDLTEEEFYSLRREQNLLVDFNYFPYKLIELLQRCLAAASEQPTPSFSVQLAISDSSNAILSFLEMTSFRQVTQLSLKVRSVESEVMKRQLSDLLKIYREQIASLQSQLTSYSQSHTHSQGHQFTTTTPITPITPQTTSSNSAGFGSGNGTGKMPSNFVSASGALVREKDEACAHLNQLYEVTREAKAKIEEENLEVKREYEGLKNRFDESQGEVSKANEIISKLQDELRILKAKLKSATAIADDQMNAAEQLRASNKRLQVEYNETAEKAHTARVQSETLERDNKSLKTQIEQLERQIQQRDAIIAHHQRQSNVKDLDRALRFNENINTTNTNTADTSTTSSTNANAAADFTFDTNNATTAFGYVGSKIFDQTF